MRITLGVLVIAWLEREISAGKQQCRYAIFDSTRQSNKQDFSFFSLLIQSSTIKHAI